MFMRSLITFEQTYRNFTSLYCIILSSSLSLVIQRQDLVTIKVKAQICNSKSKNIFLDRIRGCISPFQGEPFILGSDYPSNKKAEVYRQESDQWVTLPDFPFAKENIIHYGIASTHG